MLTKTLFLKNFGYQTAPRTMFNTVFGRISARGKYKAGQEPAVWINKETKVICQGMTGKQVSARTI